jgi:hypothetical protein
VVIVGGVESSGVTAFEALLGGLSPSSFVATTVNVYDVEFVSPVTVHCVAVLVEHVCDPGLDVTA